MLDSKSEILVVN